MTRPCGELEAYLASELVGQQLALQQFSDAVCDHLATEAPTRPLIVSFHGPPGVGKSMMHLLAARALYNQKVVPGLKCPGRDCSGYKVGQLSALTLTQTQLVCLQKSFAIRSSLYTLATGTRRTLA